MDCLHKMYYKIYISHVQFGKCALLLQFHKDMIISVVDIRLVWYCSGINVLLFCENAWGFVLKRKLHPV